MCDILLLRKGPYGYCDIHFSQHYLKLLQVSEFYIKFKKHTAQHESPESLNVALFCTCYKSEVCQTALGFTAAEVRVKSH